MPRLCHLQMHMSSALLSNRCTAGTVVCNGRNDLAHVYPHSVARHTSGRLEVCCCHEVMRTAANASIARSSNAATARMHRVVSSSISARMPLRSSSAKETSSFRPLQVGMCAWRFHPLMQAALAASSLFCWSSAAEAVIWKEPGRLALFAWAHAWPYCWATPRVHVLTNGREDIRPIVTNVLGRTCERTFGMPRIFRRRHSWRAAVVSSCCFASFQPKLKPVTTKAKGNSLLTASGCIVGLMCQPPTANLA